MNIAVARAAEREQVGRHGLSPVRVVVDVMSLQVEVVRTARCAAAISIAALQLASLSRSGVASLRMKARVPHDFALDRRPRVGLGLWGACRSVFVLGVSAAWFGRMPRKIC